MKPTKRDRSEPAPAIVWLRQDLRLADNPALQAACRRGGPVVPVFVWAPEEEGAWPPGSASRWWLHQSLAQLAAEFRAAGAELVIRQGSSLAELQPWPKRPEPTRSSGTGATNRPSSPATGRSRKPCARRDCRPRAITPRCCTSPGRSRTRLAVPSRSSRRSGEPAWPPPNRPSRCPPRADSPPRPAGPRRCRWPRWDLEPKLNWTAGLRAAWRPGSAGANAELQRFLRDGLLTYAEGRNRPDLVGTSRLSPHLHFGEISPRQVWHAVRRFAESQSIPAAVWRSWQFLTELGWREFAHHLLFHFPHTPEQPLRPEFARFPWRKNPAWLRAWQRGRTGYPLVDAGMRELWSTGWMHNRVRMVVASFLVKNLLLPWQEGARWFWDTLVDADLANNTLGWQWTAGCGADAAPFFRIFNPVSQGEKFDPEGSYVRRWVPELARLPDAWIHQPWQAPPAALAAAGVELGRTYPRPIVSHLVSREVALEAYQTIRRTPRHEDRWHPVSGLAP